MRVAIIQIGIPLQSYTRDLVNGLSDSGVDVILVTSSSEDRGFIDLSTLKCDARLVRLDALRHLLYRRIRPRIASFCGLHLAASPQCVQEKVLDSLREVAPVDLVIGVEKESLDLAAKYASIVDIPYIYYSAELYLEDHPRYEDFGWQRKSEITCHRGASATIIQDKYRWEVLKTTNGINAQKVFYLPVGIAPRPDCEKISVLVSRPSPDAQKTAKILYLGYLTPYRFSGDLIRAAGQLPPSIAVHLHGPAGSPKFEAWARKKAQCANVKITTNLLSEHDLPGFVRGYDIGLALYSTAFVNDRMTAFSSQKIALYLSENKPIITFRSETYEALFGEYNCGVMIDSLVDLQGAIELIMNNYAMYVSEAERAFKEVYDLNNYWESLVLFLNAIIIQDTVR